MEYRYTWLGILVAIIGLVIGTLLGGLLAYVYSWFLIGIVAFDLFDITFLVFLLLDWAPPLFQGIVGGFVAIWSASKITKYANLEAVAYSVSTLVVALTAFSGYVIITGGEVLKYDMISIIAGTAGILITLITCGKEYNEDNKARIIGT